MLDTIRSGRTVASFIGRSSLKKPTTVDYPQRARAMSAPPDFARLALGLRPTTGSMFSIDVDRRASSRLNEYGASAVASASS